MRYRDREDIVTDFHKSFGHPVGKPLTTKELSLRHALIYEEYDELKTEIAAAMADVDMYGAVTPTTKGRMLKEMADLQYVLSGMAVAMGLPLQEAFNRVHKSNLTKLGVDGKPVYNELGKVMKGPNYSPPDMESLVENSSPFAVPGYEYYS